MFSRLNRCITGRTVQSLMKTSSTTFPSGLKLKRTHTQPFSPRLNSLFSRPSFTSHCQFSNTSRISHHPANIPLFLMGTCAISLFASAYTLYHTQCSPQDLVVASAASSRAHHNFPPKHGLIVPEELLIVEPVSIAYAPNVPPPITRTEPRKLLLNLNTTTETFKINGNEKFEFWPFNKHVPGPIIRARVGDVLEVSFTNNDPTGMEHNIDFHAVDAPGGGANALNTSKNETTCATFRLSNPGFFSYHCSVGPIGVHIGRGMFGYLLVEPEHGLPPVDKEFYIVQHEIYANEGKSVSERNEAIEDGEDPDLVDFNFQDGLNENPRYVVYNGAVGSLQGHGALNVDKGDRIRIFFGNSGPNLISAFHIIGATFDHLYRDGDLLSPPSRCVQTVSVPPGSTAVVEVVLPVPGKFTIVDHSIFRVEKGCVGFINVNGDPEPSLYRSTNPERPCPNCKLH